MEDTTLIDSRQDPQQPEPHPGREQRAMPISRSVILSLMVFVLSFAVLFAGPALALHLMASSVEDAGPAVPPDAHFPDVRAALAVTTTVLQQGLAPLINGTPVGPAYWGTRDTYINQWIPNNNFGGEARLLLGQSRAYRPLLYFDLAPAAIPSNASIVSAQLGIYCYARNIFRSIEGQAYQVVRHWLPLQATWYQATTGVAGQWATAGCDNTVTDRLATADSVGVYFVRDDFHYFEITSMVQDWVETPANNEGVILIGPDPSVIYYYRSSEYEEDTQRPQLIIQWTLAPPPPTPPDAPSNLVATSVSPSQIDLSWTDNSSDEDGFRIERSPNGSTWAQIATVGADVTDYSDTGLAETTTYYYRVRAYNAAGNSGYSNVASTITGGPGAIVILDDTSACYSHQPPTGVWQAGTTGGYGDSFEYETTAWLTATARWGPCEADPIPVDAMYLVEAHWSVHSARPQSVPYGIHYNGGVVTVTVDQTKDAVGATRPNFTESGWYSLGVYPFRAGTFTTTGEYVELDTSSTGDTCADAVRWIELPGLPGPPQNVAISADPAELPSNGTAVSTIMVTVTDSVDNLVADGTMVGLTTSLGTLPYTYTEAENAAVTKLGSWTTLGNASASGGSYIRSNSFGDEAVWDFEGEALSLVYRTASTGGVADVTVDGIYVATINFASGSTQWQVERQLTSTMSSGLHTVRVRNGGVGPIWLDAFRSGASTSGGVATASLVAPLLPGTATVRATALGYGLTSFTSAWPSAQTTVSFPGPDEVWVDDDYCSVCPNDGHLWDYTAFDNIQDGVDEVIDGGIVHVLEGIHAGNVTVAKPVQLLGIGSDVVIVDGTDAAGSRGFYVDRADGVTISGFTIRDFERGIYLRGTGAGPGPRVYDATITENKFDSNNAGSGSYALYGEHVYTSTLCNNEIIAGYHGIHLQDVYATAICYNDINGNQGVGVKIDTGDDNSIDNCEIYDNLDVGVELDGTTQRNGVYGNLLQNLAWDGVLVNGSASAVNVESNIIEHTNLIWHNASGAPDANHNHGGVTLNGATNSTVIGNRISSVSNAGGSRPDAAGISLWNNGPITITGNLIQNGAGHGINQAVGSLYPHIHGNSIYGNSRFGLYNVPAPVPFPVQAQGNWWGCNTLTFGPAAPADIFDNVPVAYSPPISLALSTSPTSITADGVSTADVTAEASGYGYNILDGTWITLSSDLNTLVFPSATTFGGGQASAILRAGTIAGVATITGSAEPGRCAETVTITLAAGPPHSIEIDADPDTIPNSCDSVNDTSVVSATIRDFFGNGVPNVLVSFSSNALGSVFPATATTMAGTGVATTTFTSGALAGTGVVTATDGAALTASTEIIVTSGPPVTATMTTDPGCPDTVAANGVDTSAITVTLEDCLGNPVPDGTMVGFTTTLGSIVNYKYVEAEITPPVTSTGWTVVADASASGGARLQTSTPGAAAYWAFRGEAVSLIYRRWASGGTMRVRVDGGTPTYIDTSGSAAWLERVMATGLNPLVEHQIEVVYHSGTGTVRLDAFRSGAVTSGGIATAVLRAPALHIVSPSEVHTGTVYATSNLGHPILPTVVVTDNVCFSQADMVWVDDDWAGLADGTPVTLPAMYGDGTATIGSDAFDTIPEGVAAVATGGTVRVLDGDYPFATAGAPIVLTRTMNLLGAGGSSSVIIGSGSGNGIRVRAGADHSYIEGFIIHDFDFGLWLEGWTSNYLEDVTFASSVITGCNTGAITATYVSAGYFADNALYENDGFGFDLDTGDDNEIVDNQIYENDGFGLRVFSSSGTSTGNAISYNQVHDVHGDGIRAADGCIDTDIVGNTVHTTNQLSVPGFNSGGIVLRSTRDSTVEYNHVSDVGTASGSTDTAGIHLSGTDRNAVIQYNHILNNANDGIYLFNFNSSYPPVIHCNHIYGNGRFGLRNNVAAPPGPVVDATENWWGQNTPTRGTVPPKDIYKPTPMNVDWNPPLQLTLTPALTTVHVADPAFAITADACGTLCCILEDTPITFTTDLGGLGSPPGPTVTDEMVGGQATVMFTPGYVAGVATITATLANNGVATTTVTILPGLPASIDVEALPTSIEVGTGVSAIAALVVDLYNNPVVDGTVIDFYSSLGLLDPLTNTTVTGIATSTLYAGTIPGFAVVSAHWGFVVDSTIVEIVAGPPCTITTMIALPPAIPADGLSTSLIAVDVVDRFYNPVPDGSMVGFTTTNGSLIHEYVEAESADVGKVGSWTTLFNAGASDDHYIRTSTIGDTAGWGFRGQAVSMRYRTAPGYGRIEVRVDGGVVRVIDTSGAAGWVEEVMDTNLSATAPHTITIVALDAAAIGVDFFRSGAATTGGRAVSTLTSQLLVLPPPPDPAEVWASGIGDCFPVSTTIVQFLQPDEVWVDDDYCGTCLNDGHIWGYDAFSNMPDGVSAVASGGTVHVLSGVYTLTVSFNKPLYLDGAGSGSTFMAGADTGNAIRVRQNADGTVIEGFTIRDFAVGLWVDGQPGNYIEGFSFTDSVITDCTTGAITATYVNSGLFADNTLSHNDGYGFDLDTGEDNLIQSNYIYDIKGFGLRVFSSVGPITDNVVSDNHVYDVDWDGIRIGPDCVDTAVLSNTVHTTNKVSSPSGFNGGGIVLNATTDTTVAYNHVSNVGTAGGSYDTAGVKVIGANVRGAIRYNRILNNVNDGVLLWNYSGGAWPFVNCNHIYGNGRFGLRNNQAHVVDAEGNWWGHQPPPTVGTAAPKDIYRFSTPNNVDWDPAMELTLTPAEPIIRAGSLPMTITLEGRGGGCCILPTTPVTFETNLGGLGDPPAPSFARSTSGCETVAMFTPGGVLGTATITATVPNNGVVTTTVEIIAGLPYSMTFSASPPNIWPWDCRPPGEARQSTIGVTVTDQFGNPNVGEPITWTLSPGLGASLEWTAGILDANGYHLTILDSGNTAGTAIVSATVVTLTRAVSVEIMAGVPGGIVLESAPSHIAADGVATATITATVGDECGNLAQDGTMVGFASDYGTVPHDYVEAESTGVISSTGEWTWDVSPSSSGGHVLVTDVPGAQLQWQFYGSAVSVIYPRSPLLGRAELYVDGVYYKTVNMYSPFAQYQMETVAVTGLDPLVAHDITVKCVVARIAVDALRSGTHTTDGVATVVLTSERQCQTATITGTAVDSRIQHVENPPFDATTVLLQCAELYVSKMVEPTGNVRSGQAITFTIEYHNYAAVTSQNTVITDALSNGVLSPGWLRNTWFSTAPTVVVPEMHYRWSLGDILPDEGGVISFGGIVTENRYWPPSTVITNTAAMTSSLQDPGMLPNMAVVTTTVLPGHPTALSLVSSAGSIPVGGATTLLRVTGHDAYGNPLADGTVVSFTTDLGGFPEVQQRARMASGGEARVNLTSGPVAGTAHITAMANPSVNIQVIFTPLGPYTITLTADPAEITVNGATSTIEALVVDQFGNPVADGTQVTFETTAGSIAPPLRTTLGGHASTVLTSGTQAVTATVTARAGSAVGTKDVRFVPGTPRVTISANPTILSVGRNSMITVIARDEFGNPVLDGTTVAFTTTLGFFTDSLISTTFGSTIGGRADVLLTSRQVGTSIVRGAVGADSASVAVTWDPGPPHSIEITSVEPGLIPGCVGTALATAEVWDEFGNHVRDGTVVVFEVVPQVGSVEPIDGGRTTNGVAQAIIAAGQTPMWATVFAFPQGYRSSVFDQYGIEFQVGPPDRLELTVEPPQLIVGGRNATVRVRALDCGGYPVTEGTLVTFTLTSGGGSLAPQNATTANGWAVSTLTSPDQAGSATVQVTAGERQANFVVTYIPGPPYNIVLTADPLSIPANGVFTSTIRAEITDAQGNHVADGTAVAFSTDLGRFESGTSYSTFAVGGRASAVLIASNTPGIARVTALAGGRSAEIFVDFYFEPTPTPPFLPWKTYLPVIMKQRYR